jgi:hypothetical protein
MEKAKFICFVDETGQDTYGIFFLVFALLLEQKVRDELEPILEEIERKTGKYRSKWKHTNNRLKEAFLQEILKVSELKRASFYSVYSNTKKYNYLSSLD